MPTGLVCAGCVRGTCTRHAPQARAVPLKGTGRLGGRQRPVGTGKNIMAIFMEADEPYTSDDELLRQISGGQSALSVLDREIARHEELKKAATKSLSRLSEEAVDRFLPAGRELAIVTVGERQILVSRKNGLAEVQIP